MPLLQVRDIPEDLYERLAKTAKGENRSIAQETIYLLKNALNQKEERAVQRIKVLEEIKAINLNTPNTFPDPALLIREDRDR